MGSRRGISRDNEASKKESAEEETVILRRHSPGNYQIIISEAD